MSLPAGKLPPELLAELLAALPQRDPRVLVGPGIGRDAAVLDVGGGRALVATTDPVTFAASDIGRYAVHVNANDVACMGAQPAWFLATLLLPSGAAAADARSIFAEIARACEDLGVTLVGGHTEVTPAVRRPVVCGTMLGEAAREDVVAGRTTAPGDVVLLARGVAIEGTALLARDAAPQLAAAGVAPEAIARAAALLDAPGISVVGAARALCAAVRPVALHDPTEGGLATALHELAEASGARVRVRVEEITVLDETRSVCDALALDPMGLLASGALLALLRPSDAPHALAALRAAAVEARVIGAIEEGPAAVILESGGATAPLARFARDEIARWYEGGAG